jgi:hypothetical protein
MSPADQQRVRDMGAQRQWRNPQGVQTSFLTADEVENLTIRSGTLTQAERDIINHHIVATIRMLETCPGRATSRTCPNTRAGTTSAWTGAATPRAHARADVPAGPHDRRGRCV